MAIRTLQNISIKALACGIAAISHILPPGNCGLVQAAKPLALDPIPMAIAQATTIGAIASRTGT
jgi:hypothetical protein